MRVILFCHSLVSDWNHGNAHFLRGVVQRAAGARPRRRGLRAARTAGASRTCVAEHGEPPLQRASRRAYPALAQPALRRATARSRRGAGRRRPGARARVERARAGRGASARIARPTRRYRLLFHDTHHRCGHRPGEHGRATTCATTTACSPSASVIRDLYLRAAAGRERAWTWHEAADTRVFQPAAGARRARATWSGSATGATTSARAELREFLIEPVRALRPARARSTACATRSDALRSAGERRHRLRRLAAELRGAARSFARFRVTVHVPRRPYVEALPGIPTIRVVRGAGLRHPAGLRAVGRRRGPVQPGARLPGRPRRRRDDARSCARCSNDPELARRARRARPQHDPRPPHLRAPRRRAARHLRRARRAPAAAEAR